LIAGNRPTIAAGFARALCDLAVAKGAPREVLLNRAAIAPEELADPDFRVPMPRYVALMQAAKELARDPALALHFGEAFTMDALSIVGLIGMSCQTMGEALEQIGRYGQLVIDIAVDDPLGRRLVLQREMGQVWLVDTRSDPNAFPELTESSFARMAAASQRKRAERDFVRAIHVSHKAPSYRDEYDRVFGLPVVFESDRNALLMADDSFLSMTIPNSSRYVFGVLSARADALLKELEAATTTRGAVERLLLPVLHKGSASMEAVAAQMGMSRQTLFRRLKAEGLTFEKVLEALRRRLALDYLQAGKVSVTEAAYLVGFSDPAAFTRAVKRWTGETPRDLKRRMLQ